MVNFDTKYLIRWGIPGWIMIMILGPYLVLFYEDIRGILIKENVLLGMAAALTAIGVPLGYILGQLHHSIMWVIVEFSFKKEHDNWSKYFEKELKLDKLFSEDKYGAKYQERYRYLLSKKHELGGASVGLIISCIVILILNVSDHLNLLKWLYFTGVFWIMFFLVVSRCYSSKNIDIFFNHCIEKSEKITPQTQEEK